MKKKFFLQRNFIFSALILIGSVILAAHIILSPDLSRAFQQSPAWAERAGKGEIVPACASSKILDAAGNTAPTCSNGVSSVTVQWSYDPAQHGACTSAMFTASAPPGTVAQGWDTPINGGWMKETNSDAGLIARRFQANANYNLQQASFYIARSADSLGTLWATVEADVGGEPSGTVLSGGASIEIRDVREACEWGATCGTWLTFNFPGVQLTAGTNYWIVLRGNQLYWMETYVLYWQGGKDPSLSSKSLVRVPGGIWYNLTADNMDLVYRTYTLPVGTISGQTITGRSCTDSYTWEGGSSNTAYNYAVSFLNPYPSAPYGSKDQIIDRATGSFTTPQCEPVVVDNNPLTDDTIPPTVDLSVVGSSGETASVSSNQSTNLTIMAGDPTFTWTSSNADSCLWSPARPPEWNVLAGTQTMIINTSGAYSITCANQGFSTTNTINVLTVPGADIKANDSDGPLTVAVGQPVTLTWSSIDTNHPGDSCAITSRGNFVAGGTSGVKPVTPRAPQQTYTLTCTNANGSNGDSVTVNVDDEQPIARATISKDDVDYSDSVSVTKGVPTKIYLSAAGSSDPDGWKAAAGMSNGGKCEWNSDLNQGVPTYEEQSTVTSPESPEACNIQLGELTFDDPVGTYTYGVLKITDNAGYESDEKTVDVNVTPVGAKCGGAPAAVDPGQPVTWSAAGEGGAPPQNGNIEPSFSFPKPFYPYASGSDGSNMLIVGYDTSSGRWRIYQTSGSGWTEKKAPPGLLFLIEAPDIGNMMDNGNLYYVSPSRNYRYNLASNAWTANLSAPGGKRKQGTSAILDGKIYFYRSEGGMRVYDISANKWSNGKDPVIKRSSPPAVLTSVGGKLYLAGGDATRTALEVYDPSSDAWTAKTSAPLAISPYGSAFISGKIYIFSNSSSDVLSYDPISDAWKTYSVTPAGEWPSQNSGVGSLEGKAYIAGGKSSSGGYTNSSWKYQLPGYQFIWTGSDNLEGEGETIQKTYVSGGKKSAQVTVSDGINTAGPFSCKKIRVTGAAPVIENMGGAKSAQINTLLEHTGALASDLDGDLASFQWEFKGCPGRCPDFREDAFGETNESGALSGGGPEAEGEDPVPVEVPAPRFIPRVVGSYILKLTVWDARGNTANGEITDQGDPPSQNPEQQQTGSQPVFQEVTPTR